MDDFDYPIPTIDNPPTNGNTDRGDHSTLGKAVSMWREGHRIPMTLAQDLMEQGFDVPSLEAHHSI